MDDCFIKDRPEDVSWLCSLSESEIDMLVNLKLCIRRRAKEIGHEELAEKFDLKVLRAIVFILMEYLKEKMKESSHTLDEVKPHTVLDACNLLRWDREGLLSVEDLSKNIGVDPELHFLLKGTEFEPVRDKPKEKRARTKESQRGKKVASGKNRDQSEQVVENAPQAPQSDKLSKKGGTNKCSACGHEGHKKSTCREAPSSSNPQPTRRTKRQQNQNGLTLPTPPSQQPPKLTIIPLDVKVNSLNSKLRDPQPSKLPIKPLDFKLKARNSKHRDKA